MSQNFNEPKRESPLPIVREEKRAGHIYEKTWSEHGANAIGLIFAELRKAELKHPGWPEDKIHAVGILVEEAGEAMQAAIDCTYSNGDIEKLRIELAQTGAMAIRALLHLTEPQGRNENV